MDRPVEPGERGRGMTRTTLLIWVTAVNIVGSIAWWVAGIVPALGVCAVLGWGSALCWLLNLRQRGVVDVADTPSGQREGELDG